MCHTQYNQVHIFGVLRKIWFISGDFSVHFDINLGYGDCAFEWVVGRGSGKQSLILLYNEHGNELREEHFSSELTFLSLPRKCFLYQRECRHPPSRGGKQGSLVASYYFGVHLSYEC